MMVEALGRSFDDSRYGITTVKPNRTFKKCRIRSLLIEYIISDAAVILTIPKSCGECECMDDCTDDFILQTIEKTNGTIPSNSNYFLP
jgi:hypothetical protein